MIKENFQVASFLKKLLFIKCCMLVRIIDRVVVSPEVQSPSRLLHSFGSARKLCIETALETAQVPSQKWSGLEAGWKDNSELNVGKKGVARERKHRKPQGKESGQSYLF